MNNDSYRNQKKQFSRTYSPNRGRLDNVEEVKISEHEKVIFALYFNRAIDNILKLANCTEDSKITDSGVLWETKIKPNRQILEKISHFIWLFSDDSPNESYSNIEIETYTKLLIGRLYDIRNYFSHSNDNQSCFEVDTPINRKDNIYVLLEGFLLPPARYEALVPGCDADIISEISLFSWLTKEQKKFTKDGLVFFCCLFLYKDEAHDFCQCFREMKKGGFHTKALLELYTKYSCRRGRQSLDMNADDKNFLKYMEIINYLNKTPEISLEYLALDSERKLLLKSAQEAQNNGASEENVKRFDLFPRKREKFLTYALRYIEDFSLLDCLNFKRLDTSCNKGRKKYAFGRQQNEIESNYIITTGDTVHFSFIPEKNYGQIKIKNMKGSIYIDDVIEFILLENIGYGGRAKDAIVKFYTAYHHLLEALVNLSDEQLKDFNRDDFLPFLEVLTGEKQEKIWENFTELTHSFLPRYVQSIFIPDNGYKVTLDDLKNKYQRKIEQLFQIDKKIKTEKVSDGLKIRTIFAFFHLHLSNCEKFRQIPRSELHLQAQRGIKDYEYQIVHQKLGKYSSNPKKLWRHFEENNRSDLLKKCKYIKHAKTLDELTVLAISEMRRFYIENLKNLQSREVLETSEIIKHCKIVNFPISKNVISQENIIASILKIDRAIWKKSYHHKEQDIHQVEHEVSQIRFPNCVLKTVFNTWVDTNLKNIKEEERNQFTAKKLLSIYNAKEFQLPSMFSSIKKRFKLPLQLRDFYDCSTLIQWLQDNKKAKVNCESAVKGAKKNQIQKAIKKIKALEHQDSLLLLISQKYYEKVHTPSKMFKIKNRSSDDSVYDFFNREVEIVSSKGHHILAQFEDIYKLDFFHVFDHYEALCDAQKEENDELGIESSPPYSFNDLRKQYKIILADDMFISKEFIPLYLSYENERAKHHIQSEKLDTYVKSDGKIKDKDKDNFIKMRNASFHAHFNIRKKYPFFKDIYDILFQLNTEK